MSRHASNPFLSDWDDDDAAAAARRVAALNGGLVADLFGSADGEQIVPVAAPMRRSSCSQADDAQPPSGRLNLYRRNMSSFEAASLQLEAHQQQMLENGSSACDAQRDAHKDLIAKMTADFQSAIQTSDKQFDDYVNPFDPFETIVDDDPLSSPAPQTAIKPSNNGDDDDDDQTKASQPPPHDSIDDDDAELVSTPVRNIKSSSPAATDSSQQTNGREQEQQQEQQEHERNIEQLNRQADDSIAKAALFASLLASAENQQQHRVNQSDDLQQTAAAADDNSSATHVIKGSPTSGGGETNERPVGFFDPFETVVDKDALTSLVSANESSGVVAAAAAHASGTIAPQPTPLKRPAAAAVAVPPTTAGGKQQRRNKKKKNKKRTRKKSPDKGKSDSDASNSDDSDSDDDDRIQIVIRAKPLASVVGSVRPDDDNGQAAAVVVPLLPPPPSKGTMLRQARERGKLDTTTSPLLSYKQRKQAQSDDDDDDDDSLNNTAEHEAVARKEPPASPEPSGGDDGERRKFVIEMSHSLDKGYDDDAANDDDDDDARPDTPLYDEDTSYALEEFPAKFDTAACGWSMMLRYPPKKKLTATRSWKSIYVRLAQVAAGGGGTQQSSASTTPTTCWALQIFDKQDDRKALQEIPIQATYTVSEISSQAFDQFGKIFTLKLQYIFYRERVGVRQGQLARFIHGGGSGTSTTSGGHGVDPISIGALKRIGAPIEHSPQVSQIIKLGCHSYECIRTLKDALEDCLFRMPSVVRDRALTTYKTEEVQMAVRDETYVELNQIGTITKQLARVRLFFLSFLNGMPSVEVGINDALRQGREVVGRMDILPVVTEEWIRLEACQLHSSVSVEDFERLESRIIKLTPPDATYFELMRFRVRPPRNRELPLQVSAQMSVTRTRVMIQCDVMVPGCVSRKHGQIPCESIAIRIHIPECWIYFFREEKHFRMGSKKSVNRRPGKVKGIERFLGSGSGNVSGLPGDFNDESSLIEVTSGQAKYEHQYNAIVWRASRWPKESQSAYVQNSMKIRLPLTAYDKMPDSFYDYCHVEYTMPATTVSHTTLRSISVNPCEGDEPPEKYVKYTAKYEYKVKMRLSVNLNAGKHALTQAADTNDNMTPNISSAASPIVMMKHRDNQDQDDDDGLQREEDSDDDDDDDDDDDS